MIASIAVKLKGGGMAPPRPRLRHMAWSWAGAATAIGLTGALSSATATPWLMAPFGATAVLVFGLPDSPLAQPRNVVGGHLLTSLVGLVFLTALGPQWWSMALAVAVATAIAAMQMTRMVHPPAGANPLLIMATGASWSFLATPVLTGSVAIVLVALLCNNLAPERRYPMYWW